MRGARPRQRFQAAQTGHREIEEDEVRLQAPGELHCLLAVAGLTDNGEAVLLEQADERRPRQRVVVDDKRAPAHTSLIGTAAYAD